MCVRFKARFIGVLGHFFCFSPFLQDSRPEVGFPMGAYCRGEHGELEFLIRMTFGERFIGVRGVERILIGVLVEY